MEIPDKVGCQVKAGDALYIPSFWWHEVQSSTQRRRKPLSDNDSIASTVVAVATIPLAEAQLNIAVNYWYKPFFRKEFPCPECKMKVNLADYKSLVRIGLPGEKDMK